MTRQVPLGRVVGSFQRRDGQYALTVAWPKNTDAPTGFVVVVPVAVGADVHWKNGRIEL